MNFRNLLGGVVGLFILGKRCLLWGNAVPTQERSFIGSSRKDSARLGSKDKLAAPHCDGILDLFSSPNLFLVQLSTKKDARLTFQWVSERHLSILSTIGCMLSRLHQGVDKQSISEQTFTSRKFLINDNNFVLLRLTYFLRSLIFTII